MDIGLLAKIIADRIINYGLNDGARQRTAFQAVENLGDSNNKIKILPGTYVVGKFLLHLENELVITENFDGDPISTPTADRQDWVVVEVFLDTDHPVFHYFQGSVPTPPEGREYHPLATLHRKSGEAEIGYYKTEMFNFSGGDTQTLNKGKVVSGSVEMWNSDETEKFIEGVDYDVDYDASPGEVARAIDGSIDPGETVVFKYEYDETIEDLRAFAPVEPHDHLLRNGATDVTATAGEINRVITGSSNRVTAVRLSDFFGSDITGDQAEVLTKGESADDLHKHLKYLNKVVTDDGDAIVSNEALTIKGYDKTNVVYSGGQITIYGDNMGDHTARQDIVMFHDGSPHKIRFMKHPDEDGSADARDAVTVGFLERAIEAAIDEVDPSDWANYPAINNVDMANRVITNLITPSGASGDYAVNIDYLNNRIAELAALINNAKDNLGNHIAEKNLSMTGYRIVNLAWPIQSDDAATKGYVDQAIENALTGWDPEEPGGASLVALFDKDGVQKGSPFVLSGLQDSMSFEFFDVGSGKVAGRILVTPDGASLDPTDWARYPAVEDVKMNGKKLTNVASGTSQSDGVNLGQVQQIVGGGGGTSPHNELAGLQGGSPDSRYHLDSDTFNGYKEFSFEIKTGIKLRHNRYFTHHALGFKHEPNPYEAVDSNISKNPFNFKGCKWRYRGPVGTTWSQLSGNKVLEISPISDHGLLYFYTSEIMDSLGILNIEVFVRSESKKNLVKIPAILNPCVRFIVRTNPITEPRTGVNYPAGTYLIVENMAVTLYRVTPKRPASSTSNFLNPPGMVTPGFNSYTKGYDLFKTYLFWPNFGDQILPGFLGWDTSLESALMDDLTFYYKMLINKNAN